MSELTTVPFYGDEVQAVREGAAVSLVLKRVCENLGLDPNGQQQRVKRAPWAVACMTHATGADGKSYEMFCLSLDSLPMWLATIDANRVKPEARFKLVAYQKECARVLRDHFFGRREEQTQQSALLEVLRQLAALSAAQSDLATQMKSLASGEGTVAPASATWLKRTIKEIATAQAKLGEAPSANAARRRLYNRLGASIGWGGPGRAWAGLPAHRFPDARAQLSEIQKEISSRVQTRARQLELRLIEGGAS